MNCELPSSVFESLLSSSRHPGHLLQRAMARGRTRGHKGGRKQFSNPDQIKDDMAKEEEKRLWREQHPDSESEESSEEEQPKAKECFSNSPSSYLDQSSNNGTMSSNINLQTKLLLS